MFYLLGLFGIYTLNSACGDATPVNKSIDNYNYRNKKLIKNMFQVLKNKALKSIALDQSPKIKNN